MKKILLVLAVGAIGAGVAAWAAPTPLKAAEASAKRAHPTGADRRSEAAR